MDVKHPFWVEILHTVRNVQFKLLKNGSLGGGKMAQ